MHIQIPLILTLLLQHRVNLNKFTTQSIQNLVKASISRISNLKPYERQNYFEDEIYIS